MASNYRIVEVPSIYGSMYRVEKQFLFFFFWFDIRTCHSMKDALREIEENKREENLPRERVVYEDAFDYREPLPKVPPVGPPPAPKMRKG